MAATVRGPYNYIAGSGISVGVVLNTSTGQFDVTVTNTSPGTGGTLTATSVSGTGVWVSVSGTLQGSAFDFTGDASSGTPSAGHIPLTLATVNANVGTFGDSTHVAQLTVNAKGLITGVTSVAISSLSTPVSVPNGGTGQTSLTAHGVVIGEGTSSVQTAGPNASTGIPLVSQGASADPQFGTAAVAGGGTGVTTLTSHGVIIGQGTSSVNVTSAGTSGQVLTSNGASADPTFQTLRVPLAPQYVSSSVSLTGTSQTTVCSVSVTTPNDGITRSVALLGALNVANSNLSTSWTLTWGFGINGAGYSFTDSAPLLAGGTDPNRTVADSFVVTQSPNTTTTYQLAANLSSGASGVTASGTLTAMIF